MKRISVSTIALLVVAASAAQARHVYRTTYGFGSINTRVRWSMYSHGLISGDVCYSPYATGHGGSGLVDGRVRYSPYAFGGGNSGLVTADGASYGYGFMPACFHVLHHPVPISFGFQSSSPSYSYEQGKHIRAQEHHRETIEDRRARRAALARAGERKNATGTCDGKEIIAGYLKGRNIDFKTTRILSIEGRTVSVDFLLDDGKTILKYWNPAEIPSTGQQQQRQRRFFEKYLESAEVSLGEHLQAGGKLHQIILSDRDEILAKLPQYPDLNGIEKVFASAQGEPTAAETP